ncbi:phosphatidylinositol kinase [Thecamonas trahens ATCC 50062]|uniref:Phosphatidylinositol kinase n=1 Tax=Thecamonas trahens ATCC 50062 TaxID=461836 RepID=A0A0L0DS65_THETB|nr:phosphatidylinositol kinase [Thecamonas trahens ATCC 50062]KNC55174.1 phosphatidylinositol kinase [Thecamonas trahens ATCC 50062]|eukprot:XP_013753227.1 phosphatidylinositol kinase [Thecamonas trahens ATCC 50062]
MAQPAPSSPSQSPPPSASSDDDHDDGGLPSLRWSEESGAGPSLVALPSNSNDLNFDDAEMVSRPMRELLQQRQSEVWDDDSAVTVCTRPGCGRVFGTLERRHHCRACGRIFCGACTEERIELPREFIQFPKPSRAQQASITSWIWRYLSPPTDKERVCQDCAFRYGDLQNRDVRCIIAVFEFVRFDLRDLHVLAQVCKTWSRAATICISALRQLQYRLPSQSFSAREAAMIWWNRAYFVGHNRWMVQLMRVTDWSRPDHVAELVALACPPTVPSSSPRVFRCSSVLCTRSCRENFQPMDVIQLLQVVPHPAIRAALVPSIRLAREPVLKALVPSLVRLIASDPLASSPVGDLVLDLAAESLTIASDAFWALKVAAAEAADDEPTASRFTRVLHALLVTLGSVHPDWAATLLDAERFEIACAAAASVKRYSSARSPLRLPLLSGTRRAYDALYKVGDDLRRDQAMVNVIAVMDSILRDAGFVFPVVKYRVVPTGRNRGYIEIVPNAETLEDIANKHKTSVTHYLLAHNKNRKGRDYLRDFALSTAVYTVMMYLMGVGDRHRGNVMLTHSAELFHIDYGFILGEEPFKLLPASWMRLTPGIRDAMMDEERKLFSKTCLDAYNVLRRFAPLFMTMLSLGTGTDLSACTEEIVLRFLPGVSDREAGALFLSRLHIGPGTITETLQYFFDDTMHNDEPNYFQSLVQNIAAIPTGVFSFFSSSSS